MTSHTKLQGVWSKIERAKQHISDLNVAIQKFNNSKPHRIGTKNDPQTGQKIFYLEDTRDIPTNVPLIAGDALHNLRSSLDHLAIELYSIGCFRRVASRNQVHFPFADTADKYKSLRKGIVQGTSKDIMDAFDSAKPYQGGNNWLWILHKLDIIDKHELLITVARTNYMVSVNIPFDDTGSVLYSGYIPTADTVLPSFTPMKVLCPLKVGDELLRVTAYPDIEKKVNFIIDVAFGEPEVVKSEPILPFLHQMENVVSDVISSFSRFF